MMNENNIRQLIERFLNAETTLEEEQTLYEYFSVGNASKRCIVGNASERCIEDNASEFPVTLGSVTHYDHCIGTYIHGFLDNAPVIDFLLHECSPATTLGDVAHYSDPRDFKEEQYDKLAAHVRQYVDIDRIYQILGSDKS